MPKRLPTLIGGPYRRPMCELGSSLVCRIRGRVTVASFGPGPINWPRWHHGAAKIPVFTAELVRALKTESSAAICHYWGVNRKTVTRYRRAVGAPRFTLGTQLLWSQLATKLHQPRRKMAKQGAAPR